MERRMIGFWVDSPEQLNTLISVKEVLSALSRKYRLRLAFCFLEREWTEGCDAVFAMEAKRVRQAWEMEEWWIRYLPQMKSAVPVKEARLMPRVDLRLFSDCLPDETEPDESETEATDRSSLSWERAEAVLDAALEAAQKRRNRLLFVTGNPGNINHLWRRVLSRKQQEYPFSAITAMEPEEAYPALVSYAPEFDCIVTSSLQANFLRSHLAVLTGGTDMIYGRKKGAHSTLYLGGAICRPAGLLYAACEYLNHLGGSGISAAKKLSVALTTVLDEGRDDRLIPELLHRIG